MRTPAEAVPGPDTVLAAQRGDRAALEHLVSVYLPLVYNVVGRAMNGHPDVDDVVQETMLRVVRGIGEVRDPRAFRSWLMAIAVRQVRDSHRARLAQAPAVDTSEVPTPDFTDLTITRLGLSGQRREIAEATRWLDDDDHAVLALWWQEAAGTLSRADLAEALEMLPAHAAVRVARMKDRLATSRMIVHALRQVPPCRTLATLTADWDGTPSPLWRKRLARHVRDCARCLPSDLIPAENLLNGLGLLPVPAGLVGLAISRGHRSVRSVRSVRHSHVLSRGAAWTQPKIAAAVLAVTVCAAGGTLAVVHHRTVPAALSVARTPVPASAAAAPATPRVVTLARTPASPRPAKRHPAPPAATVLTSAQKGVSVWAFTGVDRALAESGASWYYNWAATPDGITGRDFVPMIWGAADVTSATLDEVRQEGRYLLGFNEPDLTAQSDMTVQQAIDLWPRLMATGMTLGSPAVATGAATPGGWLDDFMREAAARHYRVNFITVHWYGSDFSTGPAVQELQSYLQAIYDRYHLPIWLTEFALVSFAGSPALATEAQQAAFLTAATRMLAALPYVQRYAWFALPVSSGSGSTGLFGTGAVVTAVGRAFEAAPGSSS
jgi:RNA polymerase sigma factor (sigma-70 family)